MENILGGSIGHLCVGDVSTDMDKPLVVQEDMGEVHVKWDEYTKNVKEWYKWDWKSDFGKSCP